MRTFPIQSKLRANQAVPFDLVLAHEAQALKNHRQTVERLAERGGLSWIELVAVLRDVSQFSAEIELMQDDEHLAIKVYKALLEEHKVVPAIANPVEALRSVLALFPEDVSDDGSGRVGFTKEFIATVENARKALAGFDTQPAQFVWLNLETGQFSESWNASLSRHFTPESLVHDVHATAQPLWKLLEYRCLSDGEFSFNNKMRLR